jgi:hypothetical protein
MKQFSAFEKRSLDFTLLLKDYYFTFLDFINWREAAWAQLDEITKSVVDLGFDSNQELCVRSLDLFVTFVQATLLLQRLTNRKTLLIVYARAAHCTEGNSESNFVRYADTFVCSLHSPESFSYLSHVSL